MRARADLALTRRTLLGGTALASFSALSSCGRSARDRERSAASDGPVQCGGVLRVGAIGDRSKLMQDPHGLLGNDSDFLIMSLAFDPLTIPGEDTNVQPRQAASWTTPDGGKTWVFSLQEKAAFWDGTPVTADDVVFSLQRLRKDPANAFKVPVPVEGITALDRHTVQLVGEAPNADLPLLLRMMTFTVKAKAASEGEFIGSGPFRLVSSSQGNARLERNEHWWGPTPPLDAIEVVLFTTTDAMGRALMAGQIDLASNAGALVARTVKGREDILELRRPDDLALPIIMRVADGPFADPRVRTAMKLIADREALVSRALSGYGAVANDVLGTADPLYDAAAIPQRVQDLTRARALLREAGFDTSRTYTLHTLDRAYGQVSSAQVFAEQAAGAGVRIQVQVEDTQTFYDTVWCKADLYNFSWGTNDSVSFYAQKVLSSASSTNETGWANPRFEEAYARYEKDTAPQQRAHWSQAMQKEIHEDSGYLLWGVADGVDLHHRSVHGLPRRPGYGRVYLEQVWIQR